MTQPTEKSKLNDGGSAFPQMSLDAWNKPYVTGGMTLLDYFAAKALQGFVEGNTAQGRPIVEQSSYEFIALQSYELGQAMLKVKQKLEGKPNE